MSHRSLYFKHQRFYNVAEVEVRYFVACASAITFLQVYNTTCDQDMGRHGVAHSNGDDQILLLGPAGQTVDIFGVIGQDGTGTPHNFQSGRAARNARVLGPAAEWVRSEWEVEPSDDAAKPDEASRRPLSPLTVIDTNAGGGRASGALTTPVLRQLFGFETAAGVSIERRGFL